MHNHGLHKHPPTEQQQIILKVFRKAFRATLRQMDALTMDQLRLFLFSTTLLGLFGTSSARALPPTSTTPAPTPNSYPVYLTDATNTTFIQILIAPFNGTSVTTMLKDLGFQKLLEKITSITGLRQVDQVLGNLAWTVLTTINNCIWHKGIEWMDWYDGKVIISGAGNQFLDYKKNITSLVDNACNPALSLLGKVLLFTGIALFAVIVIATVVGFLYHCCKEAIDPEERRRLTQPVNESADESAAAAALATPSSNPTSEPPARMCVLT